MTAYALALICISYYAVTRAGNSTVLISTLHASSYLYIAVVVYHNPNTLFIVKHYYKNNCRSVSVLF